MQDLSVEDRINSISSWGRCHIEPMKPTMNTLSLSAILAPNLNSEKIMRKILRVYLSQDVYLQPKEVKKFFRLANKYQRSKNKEERKAIDSDASMIADVIAAGEDIGWEHKVIHNDRGSIVCNMLIIYENIYISLLSGGQDDEKL